MQYISPPQIGEMLIPPAPWILEGRALIIVGRLPPYAARALAGNLTSLVILPVLGTIAIVGFIHYTQTPVGTYSEMAISPGIYWHGIPAFLVSHMPVDSERSRLGGRAIWGLPKEICHFTWKEDKQNLQVSLQQSIDNPTSLITATGRDKCWLPSTFIPPVVFTSVRGPRSELFAIMGKLYQVQWSHVDLDIPSDSPYAPLATITKGPHLALHIRSFRLKITNPIELL
jgi:hypothetical protein